MIRFGLRHFVALAAALALAAYAWLFTRAGADPPIRSDGYNYYVYAPSLNAYAAMHTSTASTTEGTRPPREFRTVATLLTLTESLTRSRSYLAKPSRPAS